MGDSDPNAFRPEPDRQSEPSQPHSTPAQPVVAQVETDKDFADAMDAYPKRAGGNSRIAAKRAWNARRKQGETPEALLDGVRRYRRFCDATGKSGTEFVQQAVTFFGPAKHYLEPWEIPKPSPKQRGSDVEAHNQAVIDEFMRGGNGVIEGECHVVDDGKIFYLGR